MLIINILGIVLIGLIVWWFWLYKPAEAVNVGDGEIKVVVKNGIYLPARIKVVAGKSSTIHFYRQAASPCAATVLFPDFEVSEELPLEANKSVELPPMPSGEYQFHCPMKMYIGTLIVE